MVKASTVRAPLPPYAISGRAENLYTSALGRRHRVERPLGQVNSAANNNGLCTTKFSVGHRSLGIPFHREAQKIHRCRNA